MFKKTAGIGGCWYFGRHGIGPENLQFPDNPEKDFLFGDREKANFFRAYFATARHQNVHKGTPILQSRIHYLGYIYTLQRKALQFAQYA